MTCFPKNLDKNVINQATILNSLFSLTGDIAREVTCVPTTNILMIGAPREKYFTPVLLSLHWQPQKRVVVSVVVSRRG